VQWPDGTVGTWEGFASDAFYSVERGRPARLLSPN
jgi:hypothetical protein